MNLYGNHWYKVWKKTTKLPYPQESQHMSDNRFQKEGSGVYLVFRNYVTAEYRDIFIKHSILNGGIYKYV